MPHSTSPSCMTVTVMKTYHKGHMLIRAQRTAGCMTGSLLLPKSQRSYCRAYSHAYVVQEGGKVPLNLAQRAHLNALHSFAQHLHQTGEKQTMHGMRHLDKGLCTQKQAEVSSSSMILLLAGLKAGRHVHMLSEATTCKKKKILCFFFFYFSLAQQCCHTA